MRPRIKFKIISSDLITGNEQEDPATALMMRLEFQEYQPRKTVNVHRHVDGPWFWNRYSAHPYVGCRSGCEFCYLRGGRYLGRRDPETA